MRGRVVVAVVAAGLVASGVVGGVAIAADEPDPTASCTPDPKVQDVESGSRITVVCTVPKPAPVTETVEVPGPTATVTVTATPEPTAAPSSSTPTPSSSPTPTAPPTSAPPTSGFPTETNTGLPAGWTPSQTLNGLTVTKAGTVVQDVRINGDLTIKAPNVTVRRVDVVGGSIVNGGSSCANGLTITDTRVATGVVGGPGAPAIETGGYTADNVLIVNSSEGFRDGGFEDINCGPVTIRNSYAHVVPPDQCGDWHGDTLQGYDPAALTVRNSVLIFDESATCGGTGAFTYATQPGAKVDIDGLIVKGGGYPMRLDAPGTVRNLHIVRDPGWYGPSDVNCGRLTSWSAQIVTLDANGQPVPVRNQPCN